MTFRLALVCRMLLIQCWMGFMSCDGLRLGRSRSSSCELSEILGNRGEEELVFGPIWPTKPEPCQVQNTLEVREQHLDLLPLIAGDLVGSRFAG